MPRFAAAAMVLAGAASVQLGAAVAFGLFARTGPAGAALLRLGFAAVVLCALWRPRAAGRPRGDLLTVGAFGLALGGMNWSIYEAFARIPLGIAVTLEFVGPLAVAVAGSRRPLDFVWVVLAAVGILGLAAPSDHGALDTTGVALAFLAGGLWAAYIVLAARTGRRFDGGAGLALAMAVGALAVLPAGIAGGGNALLGPGVLATGLGVALASSVIPYSLDLEALRRIPPAVFGVVSSLAPALAALAGAVLLDQRLDAREIAAVACVVCASAGATALSARSDPGGTERGPRAAAPRRWPWPRGGR